MGGRVCHLCMASSPSGDKFCFFPQHIALATYWAVTSMSTTWARPASPAAVQMTHSTFQRVSGSSSLLNIGQSPRHPPCQAPTPLPPVSTPQPHCAMRWHNAVVSHTVSGLRPLSPLANWACLHQTGGCPLTPQQTEPPWEWGDPGRGAPSSSPGLISTGGGKHKHCL